MVWDFLQRYDDSWIWRCVDHHEVTESNRNFAARDECVADAVHHGYKHAMVSRPGASAKAARHARPVDKQRTST